MPVAPSPWADMLPFETTFMAAPALLSPSMPLAVGPVVVMLPVEWIVMLSAVLFDASMPWAPEPPVTILPIEVIVSGPPVLSPKMPIALSPLVMMLKGPVLELIVMAPAELKLMPSTVVAGAMLAVKPLTLRIVKVLGKSPPLAIPLD